MVGVITSAGSTPPLGSTSYAPLQSGGGSAWAVETRNQQVMPCAGTFDRLRVKCVDPGGAAQSRAFTVRKAGADTTLTCTVSTGATTAADLTNSFAVAAGDLVAVSCTSSAGAAASTPADWLLRFTAANANEYPLLWGSAAGAAAGATRYSPVQGDGAVQTTEAAAQCVMPTGGTLSNLYVALDANMAAAGQAVTLYLNGSPTALTCTVASGAATASDTDAGHAVAVAAGDTVSLQWVNSGSNAPRPRAGIKFAPTTDGESVALAGASGGTVNQSLTRYQSAPSGTTWTGTESARQFLVPACEVRKLYARAAPASGQTAAFMVRKNTADTAVTCTVTGTATAADDTTHTDTTADGDVLAVRLVTGATSGTVTPQAGLVLYVAPAAGGGARRRRVLLGGR